MNIVFAIVGRNTQTGALLAARLTEKGQKLYNQFDFHPREEGLWLNWEKCETFDALTEAIWDALELGAKAEE